MTKTTGDLTATLAQALGLLEDLKRYRAESRIHPNLRREAVR